MLIIVVSVGILTAALDVQFMSSALAIYEQSSSSLPSTAVFLTPFRINGTTVGQTITVYANVTNVAKLDVFQIGLAWSNTTVVQCASVVIGNIFSSIPPSDIITIPGSINNTHGIVTPYVWGVALLNVTGSGTLAMFNFKVTHTGYSDVHIIGMVLISINGNVIPCNTVDYFTAVQGGNQYIVKIQGNPSQSDAMPPDNAGFYEESVARMKPTTLGGVSGLVGNMTFAINGTSMDNGAFGYFNVTIPNNLMNCSGNNADWIVELNTGAGPVLQPTRTVSSGIGTTTISLASNTFYPSGDYATSIVNIYSTNVAGEPSVTISPASATLDVGQSQLFNSSVTGGTSPYSYHWYLDGSPVSGAASVSWTFTPSLTGSYSIYVKITDSLGVTATSNTATVTVNAAPSATISPSSVTLDVGQSQTFTSTVSGGTSPFSYQWYLNGTAVSGATSASWTFTPSSTGSYTVYVKVTDSVSATATSNTATVTVNGALSVSISPTSATLDVGQSQTFTSSVSGGTSPYSYQWYLNRAVVSGATSASWTFTPSSTGPYTVYVKVTDSVSMTATSNNATVTVNGALSVTVTSTSTGASETFTANVAGGTSPFEYQWYLNGAAVSGATSTSWTFTPSSAGSYSVYAIVTDNVGMQATSNTAHATFVLLTLSANMTVPNLAFTIVNSSGQTVGTYGSGGVVLLPGNYTITVSPTQEAYQYRSGGIIYTDTWTFVCWSPNSQTSSTITINLNVNKSLTADYSYKVTHGRAPA